MALSPPSPGFRSASSPSIPSRSGARRPVSQTAAIGAAALTLAGAAAEAAPTQTTPQLKSPTWTLAEAMTSSPRSVAVSIPAPTAPIATMATTSENFNTAAPTSARWAGVVGQIQPHASDAYASAPYASGECCFSDAAKPVRFRRQSPGSISPSSMPLLHDSDDARELQQFYLLLILTLWFGATVPWILQQFWLSQQRMSYGRYGYEVKRSRSHPRRHNLYKSQRYRAVPLKKTRASRFAQPRVPVAAQRWVNEWDDIVLEGSEELVYAASAAFPGKQYSAQNASVHQSNQQPVTQGNKFPVMAAVQTV